MKSYDLGEYEKIFTEISYHLWEVCEYVNLVLSYLDKKTFSNMKIVAAMERDIVAEIKRLFNPSEIVKDGNVVSFNYKGLRIDLIVQPDTDTALFTRNYLAYDNLGDLIGQVARNLGFELEHDGLKYVLGDKKLLVTQDFEDALWFLGYNSHDYNYGFDTEEDALKFVTTNPYFSQPKKSINLEEHLKRALQAFPKFKNVYEDEFKK